ncbi:DUF4249 domain-containing protein [Catalinimonas niigatensis]|uniref:DUF4249 domain-containing protein n=1 Tax=Catalinimonas niigatensis TaxID=1397264 RepID=UPI00266591D0|nr:DUF4249 domain-containing protein [Catalinimonas niigatensis]WPP52064.1 DUF4249 domain-containing protein [Catalinimonas niigatensis]
MKNIFILTGLIFILMIAFLTSCEQDISVELPPYTPKLVVEGWIEQGRYPTVILTESAAYFDPVDSAAMRRSVITTAKVSVSDGEMEEILTLKKKDAFFPSYVYEGNEIKGEVGKKYSLKIESRGRMYTAETSIPVRASLDSLWFENLSGNDTLGQVWARFSDPADESNQYRIFTQRMGKDKGFIPVYLSALSDEVFNGETVDFALLRGAESLSQITDDLYFNTGDTVMVKFCTLDAAHFQYWKSLERELYASKNPLAASGNRVLSNIQGDAIGVWGGYGASYFRVVAK